jgi:quinol monooxygenase YgiN
MVILAVTWMAKVSREAEVSGVFSKLTEESRKEPGCVMYAVHRHKTEPRPKPTALRPTFCST